MFILMTVFVAQINYSSVPVYHIQNMSLILPSGMLYIDNEDACMATFACPEFIMSSINISVFIKCIFNLTQC